MKSSLYILTIIMAGLTMLTSCSNAKEESEQPAKTPRIKKVSKLVQPEINARYSIGELITFEITSESPVDSIIVEYLDEKSSFSSLSFEWNSAQARTGKQRLKVTVHGKDLSEVHYPRLTFLASDEPEAYTYRIINNYPHSQDAYTQGLFFKGDTLVESTGQNGKSRLFMSDYQSGEVYKEIAIPSQYFGEGSTIWNNEIFYLTWTSQIGFVYDSNLNQKRTFRYSHEGWGITTFGDTLIVSDGTEVLHLVHPQDFAEITTLQVYDHERSYANLNELEMIGDLLYANVFLENRIIAIDPKTGTVLRSIDMSGLLPREDAQNTDVLNGIAYHMEDRIFVTGKLWPTLFEVEFIPQNN